MSKLVMVVVLQIIIDRGIATKVSKEIWPWELPVYEAKFGDGACVETGTRDCECVLPDAGEEFARLHTALGVDEDTKQNFADLAYGRGKQGVNSLAKAMKASIKKVRKPRKPKDKVESGPESKGESGPEPKNKDDSEDGVKPGF